MVARQEIVWTEDFSVTAFLVSSLYLSYFRRLHFAEHLSGSIYIHVHFMQKLTWSTMDGCGSRVCRCGSHVCGCGWLVMEDLVDQESLLEGQIETYKTQVRKSKQWLVSRIFSCRIFNPSCWTLLSVFAIVQCFSTIPRLATFSSKRKEEKFLLVMLKMAWTVNESINGHCKPGSDIN